MVTWLWCAQEKFTPDNQKEVTKKVWEGEKSFLHMTCHLHLIDIAMKFQSDIPYSYRVMAHTRVVRKKKKKK